MCFNTQIIRGLFNWWWFGASKVPAPTDDIDIYNVSREYKISILPIFPYFEIDNLYPLTDHVELWNIFIVGNDKTYILANINDPHIKIPNAKNLANKQGESMIPTELHILFDSIWNKTLSGTKLQFYMVWSGKLYFINTYPFRNGKDKIIGAIMFMRAFDTMPETRFTSLDGYLIPIRHSKEIERAAGDVSGIMGSIGVNRISVDEYIPSMMTSPSVKS
jgi:hypothetical protein